MRRRYGNTDIDAQVHKIESHHPRLDPKAQWNIIYDIWLKRN